MTESRTSRSGSTISRLGRRGANLCALALLAASPMVGYCNPDLSKPELPTSEYGNASLNASSVQFGFNNTSRISQNGARETASVTQAGITNTASVTQTGMNDLAIATQYGSANSARFVQTRNNDTAIANQYGSGNATSIYQGADNATALVNQIGTDNDATVVQTRSTPLPVVVNQIGSGYSLRVIR